MIKIDIETNRKSLVINTLIRYSLASATVTVSLLGMGRMATMMEIRTKVDDSGELRADS